MMECGRSMLIGASVPGRMAMATCTRVHGRRIRSTALASTLMHLVNHTMVIGRMISSMVLGNMKILIRSQCIDLLSHLLAVTRTKFSSYDRGIYRVINHMYRLHVSCYNR